MAHSSLDSPAEPAPDIGKGHDVASLGPSDSSDSGSDVQGAGRKKQDIEGELDQHALELGPEEMESDSDHSGTGDRASADGDSNLVPDADIRTDREIDADVDDEAENSSPRAPRRP